jgi:nesprin-1
MYIPSQAHKLLSDWLNETEQKARSDDGTFLNDLSEKRATLEKFRSLQRDINSHNEMVNRVKNRLADDPSLSVKDYEASINKYQTLKDLVAKNIAVSGFVMLALLLLQEFRSKAYPVMS